MFIFLTLSVIFITLQSGLKINNISIPNIQIKQLYIKWDEKLNITADSIKFISKSKNKILFDSKKIDNTLKKIVLFQHWFETIVVKNIQINKISASLKYSDNEDGFFKASSPNFLLKSRLALEYDILKINITKFKHFKKKIFVEGNLLFDTNKLDMVAKLNININEIVKLNIDAYANNHKLFYTIEAKDKISNTNYIINLFKIPKEVKYWVIDAIKMSSLSIDKAYGWIDYNKINQAYKNFYAKVTVNKLHYKYNPKLDAIHTKTTKLVFKNGVLNIFPNQAYSYGSFLGKSWLKIDFTKKEELLTLFLKFKGSVDKNILSILNAYQIKLPFLQNSGEVNTNLKISVNLKTINVKAVGDFFTKQANFNYLGLDIDIYDAYISLNNYDVKIKDMIAKYKDIATAKVNVVLDTKAHKGEIDFKIQNVDFKDIGLSLSKQKKPLNLKYNISPKQDMIDVDKSKWTLGNRKLFIEALSIPFTLDNLIANIPTTLIKIPNILSAYISGKTSLKQAIINLKVDLLKFSYNNIKLSQSNTHLNLMYASKQTKINSSEKIRFNINNKEIMLDHLSLLFKNNNLSIANNSIDIDNMLKTNFYGYYNLESKSGILNLENLHLKNNTLDELLSRDKSTKLLIKTIDDTTTISLPQLSSKYTMRDQGWKLEIESLSKLSKSSKLLQEYNLTDGNIVLNKNKESIYVNFLANIKYPYKIVVAKNKEIEDYLIDGMINLKTNKISMQINKTIDIDIDDNIQVNAHGIGISINSILDIAKNRSEKSKKFDKNIILNSKNCYLYIDKNRRIISDKIDLQYANNTLTAQLLYNKAKAGFKLKNNVFHLYGEQFNDTFMENLFAFSKFKGGSFGFTMNGSLDRYKGVFLLKNTTVKSYRVLNNVLAFVNTIPSLITFSLPGYNINGLPVKEAYMNFDVKDDIYNISDIYVESSELQILGEGTASIKENKIDLDLNLKTDLGSNASKIPLVGYILFNKDSMSTSVDVTGALDNPNVTSHVARDIIVAPLNIIKRTFELPFKLFESDKN